MAPRPARKTLITPTTGRYFCPVALPWFGFMRDASPASRLRAAAYPHLPARSAWPRLTWLRYLVQWPLLCLRNATSAVRRWGPELAAHAGTSYWRQWRDCFMLALTWNIPPHTYYLFRFWQSERRSLAPHYLCEFESQPLLRWINRRTEVALLLDKAAFHAACRRHGVATVDNIAVFHADGREEWAGAAGELPTGTDLFLKLTDGMCGKEAERWQHDAATGSWVNGVLRLDTAALVTRCRELGRRRPRLLQPCLRNHPQLAAIAGDVLSTLRIVSYRLPGGSSRYFLSCLRMACEGAVVDNFTPGGIAVGVLPDGSLLRGARAVVGEPLDTHPETGARITGTRVPCWNEAVALALQVHDALRLDGIIGWDIAITPEGPVVVEGNRVWGTELTQAAYHAPLGTTVLPEIVGHLAEVTT